MVFINLLVLVWGLIYLWRKENIRIKVLWNRLRLLCILCIKVSKKFNLYFIPMFSLRYCKILTRLYKNWLLVSNISWRIWDTSDGWWKNKKNETWRATFVQKIHLSKKCIPIAEISYTEDLSDITFNCLSENSPFILCDI